MSDLVPEDFARLVTLFIPETVTALAFSPDGTLLAVAAEDKVHLFQIPTKLQAGSRNTPTGREERS